MKRITKLLGRKMGLLPDVCSSYVDNILLLAAKTSENYRIKRSRVFIVRGFARMVQWFARGQKEILRKTVAKDVIDSLDGGGFTKVDQNNKTELSAVFRSVQQFLNRFGY